MVSGRVLQEILVQAGLAEAHHRLRTFKASVSQEVSWYLLLGKRSFFQLLRRF